MEAVFQSHYNKAIHLLENLCTENGILASSIKADNYKRIWARDAVVCGLAGILEQNTTLIEGLKRSLNILARHQHAIGMIPSNVDPRDGKVSYGSLVGRVDTGSWYVVGACLYYKTTGDETFWQEHLSSIQKARNYLQTVTFNDRGWIYTPLSGNWADEYPVHGYTLYDNSLYLWGQLLLASIDDEESAAIEQFRQRMLHNFWPAEAENKHTYQSTSYLEASAQKPKHFASFILPGCYDLRFDAAANALGLLVLDPGDKRLDALKQFVDTDLRVALGKPLTPAFWPPITSHSADWHLLQHNYSYDFKNHPGRFHNGGIWPVWMGLFCLGLSLQGKPGISEQIIAAYTSLLEETGQEHFSEYYQSDNLRPAGKQQMGYTASGAIFMKQALSNNPDQTLIRLGLK